MTNQPPPLEHQGREEHFEEGYLYVSFPGSEGTMKVDLSSAIAADVPEISNAHAGRRASCAHPSTSDCNIGKQNASQNAEAAAATNGGGALCFNDADGGGEVIVDLTGDNNNHDRSENDVKTTTTRVAPKLIDSGPAPPDGSIITGPGWTYEIYERQSGATRGTVDKYWYSPVMRYKFRSKVEIGRFTSILSRIHDGILERGERLYYDRAEMMAWRECRAAGASASAGSSASGCGDGGSKHNRGGVSGHEEAEQLRRYSPLPLPQPQQKVPYGKQPAGGVPVPAAVAGPAPPLCPPVPPFACAGRDHSLPNSRKRKHLSICSDGTPLPPQPTLPPPQRRPPPPPHPNAPDPPPLEDWQYWFNRLKAFRKKHGHCKFSAEDHRMGMTPSLPPLSGLNDNCFEFGRKGRTLCLWNRWRRCRALGSVFIMATGRVDIKIRTTL